MKNVLLLFTLSILQPFVAPMPLQNDQFPGNHNFPADTSSRQVVVELFTSEGCSSCPAADKVLAGLATTYRQQIIVLGFHVDYWNRLGWKDRFSDPSYSERQRRYAATIPGAEVYTPQAIVNGKEEMVGSDQARLLTSIHRNGSSGAPVRIHLYANRVKEHAIEIGYDYYVVPGQVLNIALLQYNAVTDVRAGENKGLTLHHINIVRNFLVVRDPSGKVQMRLPEKEGVQSFRLVAYTQDTKTMKITGATGYQEIR